jgi:hypothetical protein
MTTARLLLRLEDVVAATTVVVATTSSTSRICSFSSSWKPLDFREDFALFPLLTEEQSS